MAQPNSRRPADYETLLQVLGSDAPLSTKREAADGLLCLIAGKTPQPPGLGAQLDEYYAAASDVSLAALLLKARNSLRLRARSIPLPDPHRGSTAGLRRLAGNAADRMDQRPAKPGSPETCHIGIKPHGPGHAPGDPQEKTAQDALEACYQMGEMISEGGMGRIFKAVRRTDKALVAVKFLSDQFVARDKIRRRFEREYRLVQSLDHPNIITLHDFGADGQRCFIVMDYVAGGDLQKQIASGRLTIPDLAGLFTRLCGALAAVHDKGIVHRDIKPSNILIRDEGGRVSPLLTDFGLARDPEDNGLTRTGMQMGTLSYSPPEQIENPHGVGPAGDIYSLGVTMYYAFSGGRLPTGDYPGLDQVNPSITEALNAVVEKCMARRPADRWQDARQLADALLAASNTTEIIDE